MAAGGSESASGKVLIVLTCGESQWTNTQRRCQKKSSLENGAELDVTLAVTLAVYQDDTLGPTYYEVAKDGEVQKREVQTRPRTPEADDTVRGVMKIWQRVRGARLK